MLVFVLSYTPLVFTLALCYGSGEEEARSVDRARLGQRRTIITYLLRS
jgi:hypothetical protein